MYTTLNTPQHDLPLPFISGIVDIHAFIFKYSTLPTSENMKQMTRSIAGQVFMSKGKRHQLINDLWDLYELAWQTARD